MPDSCINESGVREGEFRIGCPSHIDLRADPWSCSSALHYPIDRNVELDSEKLEIIPADLFEEVQVHLNMEVSISSTGM